MIDLAFDLRIEQGDFVLDVADRSQIEVLGLFGSSGAGKTTLLETIAGLREPARGELIVGGTTLFSSSRRINVPARDRRIGYVPQDSLLFPHLTVRGNMEYGMRSGPRPPESGPGEQPSGDVDTAGVATMLEIGPLLDRRVQGLSGGERQRVALSRALMTQPALLLLDEPLAGVDRERRERILPYLLRIRRELHIPLIYVTHDAAELSQIADRVLVIDAGRVVERR